MSTFRHVNISHYRPAQSCTFHISTSFPKARFVGENNQLGHQRASYTASRFPATTMQDQQHVSGVRKHLGYCIAMHQITGIVQRLATLSAFSETQNLYISVCLFQWYRLHTQGLSHPSPYLSNTSTIHYYFHYTCSKIKENGARVAIITPAPCPRPQNKADMQSACWL